MKNEPSIVFFLVLFLCLARNEAFTTTGPYGWKNQASSRYSNARRPAFTTTTFNEALSSSRPRTRMASPLFSTKEKEETVTVEKKQEEEQLSELDARVLKSMLSDDKLELDDEQNMRKLLERGVAPKTPDKPPKKDELDDDDGTYSSTLLKTLTSEALWRSVRIKAGEVLESVSIFVANRVERDAKLLAAVGLFAWERAVRDVARALPENGRSGAAVGRAVRQAARQLSNTSSYDDNVMRAKEEEKVQSMEDLNLYEELNTPMDEIKSVTQSIISILSGEETSAGAGGGRGLRTVAPAGGANNAERQRRAFERRKKTTLRKEKEGLDRKLGRAAGGVADAAWEMKREMQAETNKPGYRTKEARKAIQAGAEQTAKVLQAAREEPGGWKRILFGNPKKENVGQIGASSATVDTSLDELYNDLLTERARVVASLRQCLEAPEETWLVPEILNGCISGEEDDGCPLEIDDDALREVVTAMICLRDDLEAEMEEDEEIDAEELLAELKRAKGGIETIASLATGAAGYKAGESLSSELYGKEQEPMLLKLDEIDLTTYAVATAEQEDIADAVVEPEFTPTTDAVDSYFTDTAPVNDAVDAVVTETKQPEAVKTNMWFVNDEEPVNGHAQEVNVVEDDFVDAIPLETVDAVIVPEIVTSTSVDATVVEVNGDVGYERDTQAQTVAVLEVEEGVSTNFDTSPLRTPMVEVVSDEDVEEAFGSAKSTTVVSEEEELGEIQKSEDNVLVKITLRTLDAVVFVAEKILTVGIPGIFTLGKTASSRFAQVSRDGLGYKGWKKHRNVQDGKKRY